MPLSAEPTLYLSFDDGPHPQVTPFVLNELDRVGAKAIFFVIGDCVQKHPEVFKEMLRRGHQVGNHTFHHIKGWKSTTREYVEDTRLCQQLYPFSYFRPPYGKLSWSQYLSLSKTHRIVMWSLLSYDFDTALHGEDCFLILKNNLRDGDIIVFHDSEKAFPRLKEALPKFLDHAVEQGFRFGVIK